MIRPTAGGVVVSGLWGLSRARGTLPPSTTQSTHSSHDSSGGRHLAAQGRHQPAAASAFSSSSSSLEGGAPRAQARQLGPMRLEGLAQRRLAGLERHRVAPQRLRLLCGALQLPGAHFRLARQPLDGLLLLACACGAESAACRAQRAFLTV